MSKSVGNIFQLSEALDRYGPRDAWSPTCVSGHYRQPLAFADRGARGGGPPRSERIRNFLRAACRRRRAPTPFVAARREAFLDALADDFNTPRALAALFELVAEGNRRAAAGRPRRARGDAAACSGSSRCSRARARPPTRRPSALLAERERARAARDFERADRIRDELAERGWEVRDTPEGARLVRRAADGRRPHASSSTARNAVAEAQARPPRGCAACGRADEAGAAELDAPRGLARPPGRSSPRSIPYPYADPATLLDGAGRAGRRARPGPGPAATSAPSAARPRSPARAAS